MSQLIDKLKELTKATAQPMGFAASRAADTKPRMLLIASLATAGDASSMAGADAVVIRQAKSKTAANTLKKNAAALPGIPWGGWVKDADAGAIKTFTDAGSDFLIFPDTSRVSATPRDKKTGKILRVDSSLDAGLLRVINNLPVDAVLAGDFTEAADALTWKNIMLLEYLANLLIKPLLVPVTADISPLELKALWEAGVNGIVVAADNAQDGDLKKLRREIDKLPARQSRNSGKTEALIPYIGGTRDKEPEDDDEDEEDYE